MCIDRAYILQRFAFRVPGAVAGRFKRIILPTIFDGIFVYCNYAKRQMSLSSNNKGAVALQSKAPHKINVPIEICAY